jgi:hypothetical protein
MVYIMIDKEKRNKRQYEWQKQNTDRINFTMPKGIKEKIKAAAEKEKINPAEWIRRAIYNRLGLNDDGEQIEK